MEALRERTEPDGECLRWRGYRTSSGYGMLSVGGNLELVHRFVWVSARGPIADRMEVDHSCWNRDCCNLEHLRLTTRKQNMRNRSGAQSTSRTGIRNVRAEGGSFAVIVARERVGTFSTLEAAAAAAEVARNAKFGEYAGRG